jgi:hypothetical protein
MSVSGLFITCLDDAAGRCNALRSYFSISLFRAAAGAWGPRAST